MEYLVKTGQDINSYTEKLKYGDVLKIESGEYGPVSAKVPGITYKSLEKRKAIIAGKIYGFPDTGRFVFDGLHIKGSLNLYHAYLGNCYAKECLINGGVGYAGENNVFEQNEVCHCNAHGFHPSGSNPVGTLFLRNFIHDCIGHGIGAVGGINEKAIGNIVYNCKKGENVGGTGIFFGTAGPSGIRIEKNLIWGCEYHEIMVTGKDAVVQFNTAVSPKPNQSYTYYVTSNNAIVKNNIGIRFGAENPVVLISKSAISDYNCWFNPDEPKCISRYYNKMALETYKTYGQGLHSISQDPKFVDILNKNFKLQVDSPCKETGENGKDMGYPYEIQPVPEPEPEPEPGPEPQPEYVEKSVLIEALQGMIDKIKGV